MNFSQFLYLSDFLHTFLEKGGVKWSYAFVSSLEISAKPYNHILLIPFNSLEVENYILFADHFSPKYVEMTFFSAPLSALLPLLRYGAHIVHIIPNAATP